ncbi:LacI family DNA-binding transcriptional regulator [Tessaracoccus coleopterorum]|uniref:LacI family DNA-binding transcriptional regulator n=1 Tax=Tessaracoccus coleopterorum TaxID=2714950 RepID=UPI0018D3AE2A
MLCNTLEDAARERASIETVIAHMVSGVLIASASPKPSHLRPFERAGIPVITVDRDVVGFAGDAVAVDNRLIGRLAAEHLLEQGRFTPLVLNHTIDISPMRDREDGFCRAMAAAGHPVDPDRVFSLPFHADRPAEVARIVATTQADAVFATTNTLTGEAFSALRSQGRAIGPEIGLVGSTTTGGI